MENNLNKTAYDMLYLASCAINGYTPDLKLLKSNDLKCLYDFCNYHSMTSIVYYALNSCGVFDRCEDKELARLWKIASAKASHREILFDEERKRITDFFEKNNIWYLPLKGIIFKTLYPAAGMRQMADNDILFDKTRSDEVIRFMKSLGYSAEFEKNGIHGIYMKPPSYTFELHTAVFAKSHGDRLYQYSNRFKEIMIKNENGCGYHLSDDDFYVYFTAHEYRHYVSSGTGLRSLMDRYVYVTLKGESLNWNFIHSQLKALGIDEFEEQSRTLAMKIFSKPPHFCNAELDSKERKMLSYYASSGTHGSHGNNLNNSLKAIQNNDKEITSATKRKYLMRRLFPGIEWYKDAAPFCYKNRWAIPFFLVYRFFKGIFTHGSYLIGELKFLFFKK